MLSGFDRYFQIARCFRDEDLRADRQPEFTQIDLEMSFVDSEIVMQMAEGFMKRVYKEVLNKDIRTPFRRMKYREAMDRFGSDKPDLRFEMELKDLTAVLKETEFRVFKSAIDAGGSVRAIVAKGAASRLSRKDIDKLAEWIKDYGANGLAWAKLGEDGTTSSSYEKFLSEAEVQSVRKTLKAELGDVIFIVASDENKVAFESLGALRLEMAKRLDLIDKSEPNLLWVTEFPLFEYSKEEQRLVASHHPFTSPMDEDMDKIESDPLSVRAKAYDLVLNGNEVGGGSIRINDSELQNRMLRALGFSDEAAKERFGFLMDAFKYGAPPHGGLAFGLDRLVMLMLNCESIRDVIAFPKVSNSSELMTSAPGEIEEKQLVELGIHINDRAR